MSIFDSSTLSSDGQKVLYKVGNSPVLYTPSAAETAAALAALAPHLSHDRVAVASDGQRVRGQRSWAAEWAEGPELEDRQRLRAVRKSGECTRACGNVPELPVCTKCFVNLHKGKYKGDEKTGDFTFGYGDNWHEMLTICSQVHGWVKPSGVAA